VPSDINNALQVVGLSGDQAFVWDPVNGMRPLGITMTRPPQINNGGIIAGVRAAGEVVALFGGVEYVLPSPPDTITEVRELTDNNLLLLNGSRSWAYAAGQFYDLTTLFGGTALAINEQGMVGGRTGTGNAPFLRFPDGRVIQPWPEWPVELIGPAGHFVGIGFYGDPAGNVMSTPLRFMPMTATPRFHGINRAGTVVGNRFRFFEFSPYVYRAGQLTELLDTGMTTGCDCNVMSARAINDTGHIAGIAQFAGGAQRGVLLVPIPPAAPAGFAFGVRGVTVTLTWDASAGAIDYLLEAGSTPGANNLFNGSVGNVTSLSVSVPPGRYYVRLRARNAVGASAPTADLLIDVP
jgi:hypothetical protein